VDIREAKERLRIPDLWQRFELPGQPKASCKSPFREDRRASFSVSADGLLFHDFATGQGGSAIDFLQLATGLSHEVACKRFVELAGGAASPSSLAKTARPADSQARQKPILPDIRRGTKTELAALAKLRAVDLAACILADSVGLLRFGTWKDQPAWIVTDDERLNAQARRLDGEQWESIGAKAQTLPGSWASWPLGIRTGADYPAFMLCEGAGDLLAALHFIHLAGREADCFPVAILGASHRIHADALPLFAGTHVRIYTHADKSGREAAERWAAQLASVCAEVDCADFAGLRKADGSHIKDLNDCTSIHPNDAKELEGLLPE
jgi:CHC2 zinc finger